MVYLTVSADCRWCVGNVSVACWRTVGRQPNMGDIVHYCQKCISISADTCWTLVRMVNNNQAQTKLCCEKHKSEKRNGMRLHCNCNYLFAFNCRKTSLLNSFTQFQLQIFLYAVKYNCNIQFNSQMSCSHLIQTQAKKTMMNTH